MRVYLSGPMRGYPDDNYPAFTHAAARWRAAKYDTLFGVVVCPGDPLLTGYEVPIEVINPAENFNGDHNRDFSEYMKRDIADVITCDAVALLPGWEKSDGATKEVMTAQTVGITMFFDAVSTERIYPDRYIAVPLPKYTVELERERDMLEIGMKIASISLVRGGMGAVDNALMRMRRAIAAKIGAPQ